MKFHGTGRGSPLTLASQHGGYVKIRTIKSLNIFLGRFTRLIFINKPLIFS